MGYVPGGSSGLRPAEAAAPVILSVSWPAAYQTGPQRLRVQVAGLPAYAYRAYWQAGGGTRHYFPVAASVTGAQEAVIDLPAASQSQPRLQLTIGTEAAGRRLAVASRTLAVHQAGVVAAAATQAAPAPAALPRRSGRPSGGNPFAGARLFVDADDEPARQVAAWRSSRPADAALIQKIAAGARTFWLGDWTKDVQAEAAQVTARVSQAGALPVFVAYNIPQRDCGSYSAGGASGADSYRRWIASLAQGIGSRRAVVILEPDALAGLGCLSAADRAARLSLLADAVRTLKANAGTAVYLDAGNPRWLPVAEAAGRLRTANIALADGFSLNVSNYFTTAENIDYGRRLSAAVGNKHFVIDTSRNGRGPTADNAWCNPAGRGLGQYPTTQTGHPLVDAYLWIKDPGASDGTCNGGPAAGQWWPDGALDLARHAPY